MTYHYSLLRFVPDPVRGEFVNLGVLAGDDDSGDWELRLIQNLRRAKAIDDKGALGLALTFAVNLEERIMAADLEEQFSEIGPATEIVGISPISMEMIERLSEEMQNVVQLTAPTPLVADSAEEALDVLFAEHVVDPAAQRFRFEKKHRAVASARRAYRTHEVPEDAVKEKAPISAGPYAGRFDFAVSNGAVVQLVHCWSFQLPNQAELAEQVKAWAWVVRELREQGGLLRAGEREIAVPAGSEFEIASVSIPPAEDQDSPAYSQARAAFEETGVEELTPEQADVIGQRAAERLKLAV